MSHIDVYRIANRISLSSLFVSPEEETPPAHKTTLLRSDITEEGSIRYVKNVIHNLRDTEIIISFEKHYKMGTDFPNIDLGEASPDTIESLGISKKTIGGGPLGYIFAKKSGGAVFGRKWFSGKAMVLGFIYKSRIQLVDSHFEVKERLPYSPEFNRMMDHLREKKIIDFDDVIGTNDIREIIYSKKCKLVDPDSFKRNLPKISEGKFRFPA